MSYDSITDVPGILVGHETDPVGGTGCTVILCEKGAAAGVDVRGGAPGTREIPTLDPINFVQQAHAVYLGGGSAYGLDGAAGVMQYLEEKNIGLDVGAGVVPIVPGAVLFDLSVGSHKARPDKAMGYRACKNANSGPVPEGSVGVGTGATISKPAGMEYVMKGGLGSASFTFGKLVVGALVAVNCFGDIIDPETGKIIAGMLAKDKKSIYGALRYITEAPEEKAKVFTSNTTLGVIVTNAKLDKAGATKIAQMAQDGFARTINPIHTMYDGDTIFCLATGETEADLTTLGAISARVMERAVIKGIKAATSLFGIPTYRDLI